jgi:hypothetical protein
MIGVVIETSVPRPRPWSRYALTLTGLAAVFGAGGWLQRVCDPPAHVWEEGVTALGGYAAAHPLLALGYVMGGIRFLTAPIVLSLWRELSRTRPPRQYLAFCLTLLAVAVVTALTAEYTLGEDPPAGPLHYVYYAALGVVVVTAIPGAGGLVHVVFAWRADRKAGVDAAEHTT